MHSLYVEVCTVRKSILAEALASRVLVACQIGSAVVVCDRPSRLMDQVRTQLERLTDTNHSGYRSRISFGTGSLSDGPQNAVTFSGPSECKLYPPVCSTIFIVSKVSTEDAHMITSWMPPQAHVVFLRT